MPLNIRMWEIFVGKLQHCTVHCKTPLYKHILEEKIRPVALAFPLVADVPKLPACVCS